MNQICYLLFRFYLKISKLQIYLWTKQTITNVSKDLFLYSRVLNFYLFQPECLNLVRSLVFLFARMPKKIKSSNLILLWNLPCKLESCLQFLNIPPNQLVVSLLNKKWLRMISIESILSASLGNVFWFEFSVLYCIQLYYELP